MWGGAFGTVKSVFKNGMSYWGGGGGGGGASTRAFRIVSMDKMFRFTITLIIIIVFIFASVSFCWKQEQPFI